MRCTSLPAHAARFALVLAGALALAPTNASAAVQLEHLGWYDGAGNPQLYAYDPASPTATITWSVCDAAGTCGPTVSTGRDFKPGVPAPGSVFKATATTDGPTTTATTPIWEGPIRSDVLPTLNGTVAVGQTVTATPGSWAGGWANAFRQGRTGLRACPTAAGTDCRDLTGHFTPTTFPQPPNPPTVRISAVYEGWYIGAAHEASRAQTVLPIVTRIPDPEELSNLWVADAAWWFAAGPLTRVEPAPKVEENPQPQDDKQPQPISVVQPNRSMPPTASFRARAKSVKPKGKPAQLELATFTCGSGPCRVDVTVRQGKRERKSVVRTAAGASRTITVPAASFPGRGSLAVELDAGNSLVLAASVKRR